MDFHLKCLIFRPFLKTIILGRSRGCKLYNSSIFPIKINKYQPQQRAVQSDEKNGQSNSSAKQEQKERNYNTIYRPTPGYYGTQTFKKTAEQTNNRTQTQGQSQNTQINQSVSQSKPRESSMARQYFPNGEQTAIDYTQSKINISQVIKDFKNTTEAIGSPDDIKETVYTYVSLVQKEAEKENPNKKIIKSNLKNASQVLDEYITDTLKKPSKVVEGWIDSLFLQNVDYKYDESIINPDYEIKLPKNNRTAESSQNDAQVKTEIPSQKEAYIDTLISAKNEKNPAEALNIYESVIENAKADNNSKALSIAYFESAKLYDNFNSFDKAIENYTAAIENSNDDGLKAQAYMKIAQIQHDSSNLKDAGSNYFSSIAYFGQVDNIKAQAAVLSQTGKLVSESYDTDNAKDYFYVAKTLANEIDDKTLIGKVNQKAGDAFSHLNEPRLALDYYKDSAASYDEIQNNLELAKDYQAAAKLMLDLGNPHKARTLLNKAYKAGIKADDTDLVKQIQSQIEILS